MSNEFDWKTEEESGWEEEIATQALRPSPSFPWKPLGLFLLIALLLAAGVRWQINRQVSAVTANVESNVRAAHLFLHRVAGQQDVDLLKSLLSGRDVAWVQAQKTLVAEGWFSSPPLLGWTAVPLTASDPLTVTLSSDLFSAEVQSEQSYQLLNLQGITETVTLRQTAVYRQGKTRWLYAPPDDEFWGETAAYMGDHIIVRYPARDEKIATRLAKDLDELVATICLEITPCQSRGHVQIRFQTAASSLIQPANLPTPSLVGLPVDEASYQALFRAYGAQVARELITYQVGYECCRWQLLYESLLARQLHQLGLRPWPLTQAAYDQLILSPLMGGITRLLINRPSFSTIDQLQLYAFVEFLESVVAPGVTLADMQRNLGQSRGVTNWVNQYAATQFAHNEVDQAFFYHIIQHTTAANIEPPTIPLPGVIQMICNVGPFNGRVSLHKYDPETKNWRELFMEEMTPFWAYAQPVVSDPQLAFMVESLSEEPGEITYTLLEDGQVIASFVLDEGMNNFYLWGADPHGRYLLLGRWGIENTPAEFRLLDVAACRQGDCLPQPAGLITWSPDGRQTLLTLSEDVERDDLSASPPLWLGDATGQNNKVVGVGERPFWINDTTYGYLRADEGGRQVWVTAVVGEDSPRRLFAADELLAAIPEIDRPESLFISTPLAVPNQPDRLYVQASSSSGSMPINYFFAITLTPDGFAMQDVMLLFQSNSTSWGHLSPDGRWLVIYDISSMEGTAVTLRHLGTGVEQQLPFSQTPGGLSWSQDGKWYIQTGDGYLIFGAPDYQYQQFAFHDHGACEQAYWRE
jgi:hypothetical protein